MLGRILRRVLIYDPPDPVAYWSPRSEKNGMASVMWRNAAYNELADRDQWRLVEQHLPSRRGAVLDLGCGTGRLSERLSAVFDDYVGIDIPAMVIQARKRVPSLADCFAENSVEDYDFSSRTFDLILSMGCLAAAVDRAGLPVLAQKVVGAVRPGGRVILIDPFHTSTMVARRCRMGGQEVVQVFSNLGMKPVVLGGLHFIPTRVCLTELDIFHRLPGATKALYQFGERALRFSPQSLADYSVIVMEKRP